MDQNYANIEDIQTPWLVQIFAGFFLMIIHQAIIIPIAVFYSQVVAVVFAFILGLGLIVVASMNLGGLTIMAGILAIATSCAGGSFFYDYQVAATADIAKDISVGEIHKYRDRSCWDFRDGKPRDDLSGTYVQRRTSKDGTPSKSYFNVCPVVTSTWKIEYPVTLWAVSGGRTSKFSAKEAGFGFAVNPLHEDEYKRAVRAAEQKHGLSSFEDAILVKWVNSYEEELNDRWNKAVYFLIFMNLLWFVGAGFMSLYCHFTD